jgi:VWFA-related protein
MPKTQSLRVVIVILSIAMCAVATAQDLDNLLAQAREALQRGDDASAIGITTRILDGAPTDSRALLARSLAHYRTNSLAEAETDLRVALANPSSAPDDTGAFRWPNDFMAWVSTVRAAYAPDSELPDISLEELNATAPTRAVAAHFVMNVEVVRIPAIVEAWEGGFMSGLVADDFGVVDGVGEAAPIRALIPEHEPTSIGIIIDAGLGTGEIAPTVVAAVTKLLETLRPEDEIFIAQYSDTTQFLSDFATDRIALAASLAGYTTGNGRAMRDAIATGLIRMRSAQHEKKALIVIADGDDAGSQTSDDEILVAARREGVAVHALIMIAKAKRWRPTFAATESETAATSEQPVAGEAEQSVAPPTGEAAAGNAGLLQEIAHNTGGLVALRPPLEGPYGGLDGWIALACRDVSDYINNQYLILFRSTNPPEHGVWRNLRVRVEPRHSRIRARSGYVR